MQEGWNPKFVAYAKYKNYEHAINNKLVPWLKNETLERKFNAIFNMPYKLVAPWYFFTSDPINQTKFWMWVEGKFFQVENFIFNHAPMILSYPLSVLAANRILCTPISRSGTANSFRPVHLWRDLNALMRIGGHRTLFAGLLPMAFYMFQMDKDRRKAGEAQGFSAFTSTGKVLSEKFEMNKNRLSGTGNSIKDWKDFEMFDRIDTIRADKEWLPWAMRHFPAFYRWWYMNRDQLDDRISEVMLSSHFTEENDPNDTFIKKVVNGR